MKTLIRNKLNKVFADFKENINVEHNLCSLHNLRFDNGNIPNYKKPVIQQLYLLRYFPAYVFEYYQIYKEVIQLNHCNFPYRILSIGAGSWLDYCGLNLALQEVGNNASECVHYIGIDLVDWLYRESFNNHHCINIPHDIIQHPPKAMVNSNIIIFPKSIGEFSETSFKRLIQLFKQTPFLEKNIYLLSSIRDQQQQIDISRFQQVTNIFEEQGYINKDSETEYYYFPENVGIRSIISDFFYPNDIKNYLLNLQSQCKAFDPQDHTCITNCESLLNKSPILKVGHIKYQINRLTK